MRKDGGQNWGAMGRVQTSISIMKEEGLPTFFRKSFHFVKESLEEKAKLGKINLLVSIDAISCRLKIYRELRKKGLFLDCGSNLGQGFSYFKEYFRPNLYDYILIEPNPYCALQLAKLKDRWEAIEIIEAAVSTKVDRVKFYGLTEDDRGKTSDGGSVLKDHNSSFYTADETKAIEVNTFSLSDLIQAKKANYSSIVLKLDIEGSEYEVLEDLIANNTHTCFDALYVEFHSQYMLEPKRGIYKKRESEIIKRLKKDKVRCRIWV